MIERRGDELAQPHPSRRGQGGIRWEEGQKGREDRERGRIARERQDGRAEARAQARGSLCARSRAVRLRYGYWTNPAAMRRGLRDGSPRGAAAYCVTLLLEHVQERLGLLAG